MKKLGNRLFLQSTCNMMLIIILAACSQRKVGQTFYEGPPLYSKDICMVIPKGGYGGRSGGLEIVAINKQNFHVRFGDHGELLPGKYKIALTLAYKEERPGFRKMYVDYYSSKYAQEIDLTCEAGHAYVIDYQSTGDTWTPFIQDETNKAESLGLFRDRDASLRK